MAPLPVIPELDTGDLYKRLRLRVAAHSCHEQATRRIHSALQSSVLDPSRLHFNAYLCETPVIHNQPVTPIMLAPFIDREIARLPLGLNLQPEPSEEDCEQFLASLKKALKEYKPQKPLPIELSYTDRAETFKLWKNLSVVGPISGGVSSKKLFDEWKKNPTSVAGITNPEPFTAEKCVADIKTKLNNEDLDPSQKLAYLNIIALLYYHLLASVESTDCLFFVAVPLATCRTFHGILIASIEVSKGKQRLEDEDQKREIHETLNSIQRALQAEAQENYLPTLVLSQNSWEEHVLFEYIKHKTKNLKTDSAKRNGTKEAVQEFNKNPARTYAEMAISRDPCAAPAKPTDNDLLEDSIIDLWKNRLRPSYLSSKRISTLEDSLVFRKMMVASPGLIRVVRQVAKLKLSKPSKPKDPLPAVLVVAPPGSGKENMSRLIPLFSPDFWDKKIVPLNMGAVPSDGGSTNGLEKIFNDLTNKNQRDALVIVLDELNSLHIAAQPQLLRLLEQGEISPLESHKGVRPWLMIGLINEPPDRLTLEGLRERVSDQFLFGELLGSALYEHWKRQSRLRDDLYYRICRSGEIRMSELNERRPDIPIVFYFLLRGFFRESDDKKEVFLTYDAMMRLIDDSLDWKGNIRKLEAVARSVKGNMDPIRLKEPILKIDAGDIEDALRSVGMLKERSKFA